MLICPFFIFPRLANIIDCLENFGADRDMNNKVINFLLSLRRLREFKGICENFAQILLNYLLSIFVTFSRDVFISSKVSQTVYIPDFYQF